MGFEWRCFLDGNCEFDLWNSLGIEPPKALEKRDDVYFVGSEGIGLKLRGGRVLEAKYRSKRKKHGTEKWKKYVLDEGCYADNRVNSVAVRQSLSMLPHEELNRMVNSHGKMQGGQAQAVNISKTVHKTVYSNVCLEQTTLKANIKDDPRPPRGFKTICVEGSRPNIKEFIYGHNLGKLAPVCVSGGCQGHSFCKSARPHQLGCFSMGYPAFVMYIVNSYHPTELSLAERVGEGEAEGSGQNELAVPPAPTPSPVA